MKYLCLSQQSKLLTLPNICIAANSAACLKSSKTILWDVSAACISGSYATLEHRDEMFLSALELHLKAKASTKKPAYISSDWGTSTANCGSLMIFVIFRPFICKLMDRTESAPQQFFVSLMEGGAQKLSSTISSTLFCSQKCVRTHHVALRPGTSWNRSKPSELDLVRVCAFACSIRHTDERITTEIYIGVYQDPPNVSNGLPHTTYRLPLGTPWRVLVYIYIVDSDML